MHTDCNNSVCMKSHIHCSNEVGNCACISVRNMRDKVNLCYMSMSSRIVKASDMSLGSTLDYTSVVSEQEPLERLVLGVLELPT